MAKNNNLTDFLTDVANAIREKDGTTGTINPQDFSDKIKAIQTGVDTSDGNIEPTTVLKGYKGYAKGVAVNGAIETYDGSYEDLPYTDCLTFTGETSEFTLKATYKEWDGTLQWSTDHTNWTTLTGTEAMQSVGKKLYLRGKGNTKFKTSIGIAWRLSAKAGCSGNIQTLLDWESPPTSISTGSCYEAMFWNCTNLTTAPELPATTLAQNCYNALFSGCTNLTTAPELPATTLANYCYRSMFVRCSNLTTAPALPATTLAQGCYYYMFSSCSNLTTAPALPATKLADDCYNSMFNNCTKLKLSTTQTTEYKTPWRIPSSGTISNTSTMWSRNMLKDTGGTFTGSPNINTTYYGAW